MRNSEGSPSAATERRARAEQMARAEAARRPEEFQTPLREEIEQLRVSRAELALADEELRRLRAELESARAKCLQLYDGSPFGYCTLDREGLILEANLAACTLLGAPHLELIGRPLAGFVHPDDLADWRRALSHPSGADPCAALEVRMRKTDGSVFWADLRADAAPGTAGAGFRAVLSDITSRKRSEEAMRESEQRHRDYITNTPYGVFEVDEKGRYVQVNPSACRITGYSEQELLSMSIADLCFEDSREEALQHFEKVVREGKAHEEPAFRHKSGERRWWSVMAVRLSSNRFLGFSNDITERKRAEDALRESETNFRAFFETIGDMVVVFSPGGRILRNNKVLEGKLGYDARELAGMHVLDLHPAGSAMEAGEAFSGAPGGEGWVSRVPLRRKDGSLVPVETRGWSGRWNGEECVFAVSKDLSAEQEVQQRLESLFRRNPALMALNTPEDLRFVDVNDTWLASLGYTREEVIGRTVGELGLSPNPEQLRPIVEGVEVRGGINGLQIQVRRKDGEVRDGLFSGEVISSQGKDYFLTVMLDITERKAAERKLAAERERLANILEGTNAGTWEWNVQTGETVFNENWAGMLGYSLGELSPTSIHTWERLTHPEDLRRARAALECHFAGELPYYTCEIRMRHKDGHWVWVHDRGRVISRTGSGEPLLMFGTHADITGRKRAEEALRAKTEELDRYFTSSLDLLCIGDTDGYFRRLNPEWECVLGYPLEEIEGARFVDFVHPDDQPATRNAMAHLDAQQPLRNFTNRYRCRDGSYRWIEWRSRPDGKLIYAAARDVTEQVNARAALHQALEEKEGLLREVHHRVKNNLQVVSSLVNLQCRSVKDAAAQAALHDTHTRIRSMALLHENLYRSGQMDRVECRSYVEHLCMQIAQTHNAASRRIAIRASVSPPSLALALDQAVPCGLLVTELVTNACKHAFPGGRSGTVSVEFAACGSGEILLRVVDDGVGLPEDLDVENSRTMGLDLVTGFAQQIRGRLSWRRGPGACFEIRFVPKEEA